MISDTQLCILSEPTLKLSRSHLGIPSLHLGLRSPMEISETASCNSAVHVWRRKSTICVYHMRLAYNRRKAKLWNSSSSKCSIEKEIAPFQQGQNQNVPRNGWIRKILNLFSLTQTECHIGTWKLWSSTSHSEWTEMIRLRKAVLSLWRNSRDIREKP